jgi:hypothetical protein
MIPYANTTVSVLRSSDSDLYTEPTYGGTPEAARGIAFSGIRASIGLPSGSERLAAGQQSQTTLTLICDEFDGQLSHLDGILDETTNIIYEVQWAHFYYGVIPHWEASLLRTEGLE